MRTVSVVSARGIGGWGKELVEEEVEKRRVSRRNETDRMLLSRGKETERKETASHLRRSPGASACLLCLHPAAAGSAARSEVAARSQRPRQSLSSSLRPPTMAPAFRICFRCSSLSPVLGCPRAGEQIKEAVALSYDFQKREKNCSEKLRAAQKRRRVNVRAEFRFLLFRSLEPRPRQACFGPPLPRSLPPRSQPLAGDTHRENRSKLKCGKWFLGTDTRVEKR